MRGLLALALLASALGGAVLASTPAAAAPADCQPGIEPGMEGACATCSASISTSGYVYCYGEACTAGVGNGYIEYDTYDPNSSPVVDGLSQGYTDSCPGPLQPVLDDALAAAGGVYQDVVLPVLCQLPFVTC